MKLGILGGTFDPIHRGHLALARHALKQFKLDQILFIPAMRPPHKKSTQRITSSKHRVAMIHLALGRSSDFKISHIELKRKGPSYTVDTLRTLQKKYPGAKLYLILGQDSYESLNRWKNPARIKRMARLLVAKRTTRNGLKRNGAWIFRVRMPLFNVASSEIRKAVKCGKKIDDYLPKPVIHYILKHRLYQR